ncbi:MAG: CoB--CoM heterodisulfide reductase iron-sulfur subunit B family protein [Armatimonadetes bacterium]|nr:CoB--CoM heterodisulfide reductase iron-sulfur subunit B family protein [Armatimonadota bacterium]
MNQVSYYPGCSLSSTGKEYAESIEAMCQRLDVELVELKGWTCCGASSGSVMLSHEGATALPAMTLKLAAEFDRPVFAPCAACYNRLKVALRDLKREPELAEKLEIGERELNLKVLNTVDLLRDVVGLETLKEKVTQPLTGMRLAAYYGCLLLRPADMDTYDDAEQPTSMEDVIAAIGAEPVEWYGRMDCCGAGLAATMQGAAETLVTRIVKMAKHAGADAIVTACQLCSMNLESRQGDTSPTAKPLPVLYLSDVVGLALGAVAGDLGLGKHLVDVRPALAVKEPAEVEH